MCGKNFGSHVGIRTTLGSPPRVREKQMVYLYYKTKLGITPACAGKTLVFPKILIPNRDHPRVCGKNVFVAIFYPFAAGSPPRVREKLHGEIKQAVNSRITPACAGKTYYKLHAQHPSQDHPRVCGKNSTSVAQATLSVGSPPRVREKLGTAQAEANYFGITPACAGKTCK